MKFRICTLSILTVFILSTIFLIGCPPRPKPGAGDEQVEPVAQLFDLTILHTNDVHARIREINKYGNTCTIEETESGSCIAGVARLATQIEKIRSEKENVLLLDAGDWFQGSLFYSLYKGQEAMTFMNMLEYDAMTFGNHEFDGGVQALAEFIKKINFPLVSASVDVDTEPLLADLVDDSFTFDMGGHKIGIFGITTVDVPQISNPGPNIKFLDQTETARETAAELTSEGADIIIMLSHSGYMKDQEIAGAVDGIDVIVGGHTHTYLSNVSEAAEGPYPTVVNSPDGDPVLIVQAKSWGRYLGDLEVSFNEAGVAEEWSGEPITIDQSIIPDPDVLAMVDSMAGEVDRLSAMPIGESLTNLDGEEEICRHYESNLGNLIADAIYWETSTAGTELVFFNGGGIRSGVPKGRVTMAQMLEVLPFTDTVATLQMKGSDVKDLLEFGVSRAENPGNEGTGRFLQLSGGLYAWDPSAEVGSRIVEIQVKNIEGNFEPLDPFRIYNVATSGFLRGGGDGYQILKERAIDPYDFGRVISDVVVEFIELNSPLNYKTEGRIKRVGG